MNALIDQAAAWWLGVDALSGPDAAPAAPLPDHPHPGLTFVMSLGGNHSLLISLFGVAFLMFLLAPERNRLAAAQLRARPLRCVVFGAALLLPVAALLLWILHHTLTLHGRGALALVLLIACGTGLSVCARALVERVAPDATAATQTLLGLIAVVAPLACVLGFPVLLIGAPLGLGAWLSAARSRPTPP